eukprot:scaffold8686_cov122-Skeletonema_menzelii.AAC.1
MEWELRPLLYSVASTNNDQLTVCEDQDRNGNADSECNSVEFVSVAHVIDRSHLLHSIIGGLALGAPVDLAQRLSAGSEVPSLPCISFDPK